MIRGIVFDCYGVLTSDGWLPFKQKTFGHSSELFQQASDLNKQTGAGLLSPHDFIRQIAAMAHISPAAAADEISSSRTNTELFDYIALALKPKYRLGMLSNAGSNVLQDLFSPEHVELFDQVALSFEMGTVKPEPRAYQTIADRLQLPPEEIVFIDDQPRFCTAAEDIGMQAIVYHDLDQMKRELEQLLQKKA